MERPSRDRNRPAERHRWIAGDFTDRVHGVADWDVATPVEAWRARDVVAHLIDWSSGLLASSAGIDLPRGPSVRDDPVAAWTVHTEAVQGLLDDPATTSRVLSAPHLGDLPLDRAIDMIYTTDVFLHTWDLARATGQDDTLDAETCAGLLAGMEPLDEVLRVSGQYGPRVPVPEDADVRSRLLGFIGRDPSWAPS